jgi:peptide/nickel transport system permease protein
MTRIGIWLLALLAVVAATAPWVAVHPPDLQHRAYVFAPPMPPRVTLDDGGWRLPFYYPIELHDRLRRRFAEARDRPVPIGFASEGRVLSGDPHAPWFPLGTDALGRDVWSRLVFGARTSLGVAALATLGALLLGTAAGVVSGAAGGWVDDLLMRATDLVLVMPVLYVVLALRAALPLVLPDTTLFLMLVGVLAVAGSPPVARGVRGIVAAERVTDYATAARALGASPARVALRHLLPASRGFLITQALLLAPAFILAETTLSFVGLGFRPPRSSWGSMLQDATNVRAIADFPWVLAPALAIVVVVLALTLASEPRRDLHPTGPR